MVEKTVAHFSTNTKIVAIAMSNQEAEMLKAFKEKRKRAAQAWEETRERDVMESQALVAFEKAIAEARQSYEVVVKGAWKLYEELIMRPAGCQDPKTRRETIIQAWKSYQEATMAALESFRKEAGNNNRYEHALYLLCEERLALGGEIPDHVQDTLDFVQENIIWVQDALDWVQEIMDNSPVETVMPQGTQARISMDKSQKAVGLAWKCCEGALHASDTHEALQFTEQAKDAILRANKTIDQLSRCGVGCPDPIMMELVLIRLFETARALEEMQYDLGGVEAGLEYAQKHSVTQ